MNFQDYLLSKNLYWEVRDQLEKFLRVNPKFENAVIVKEDDIDYNFDCDYVYYYSWLVELNGKFYNMLLSQGGRYRSAPYGIKFKRYYPQGVPPIRKRNKKYICDYSYERTHKHVYQSSKGYKNDCQIWTLAKCFNLTYEEAYTALIANGWKENFTRLFCFIKAVEGLGYSMNNYYSKYMTNKPFKGSNVGNIVNRLPKKGTFAVTSRSHIFCVIDGVIYDSSFCPRDHVSSVYEIKTK